MNNDRFKFRVWDKYVQETPAEQIQFLCFNGCLVDSDGCYYSPDDYIVEQCTGLKDKNGNLIYDGDIIRWYGTHKTQDYKVVWVNAGWCLKNLRTMTTIAMTGLEASEIIGNIHERKE